MASKPDFNGPGRELRTDGDHLDESVYCVNCGTIFVRNGTGRDCPSCANASAIEALRERVETFTKTVEDRIKQKIREATRTARSRGGDAGGDGDE